MLKKTVLLVLLFFSNTRAIIETCSFWSKDNKQIILLGDRHINGDPILEPYDEQHATIIFDWLKELEAYSKPIKFIFESSLWVLDSMDRERSIVKTGFIFGLFENLAYHIRKNNLILGALNFEFADNRTNSIYTIHNISLAFKGLFQEHETMLKDKSFVNNVINFMNTLYTDKSIRDYFSQVNTLKHELIKIIADLKLEDKVQDFLNSLLASLDDHVELGKKSIARFKFNEKSSVMSQFIQIAQQGSVQVIKEFHNKSVLPTIDILADIGFIISIICNLQKYNQIVVYVGDSHAQVLNDFIKTIGFNLTLKKKFFSYDENNHKVLLSRPAEELSDVLNKAFKKQEFAEQKAVSISCNSCAVCNKKQCQKRCSNCKKVYYCSADCQKSHWQKHKLDCKKS